MTGFFNDRKTIERMKQGPLGQYVEQYAAGLHSQAYTWWSGRRMLAVVASFNHWIKLKGIRVENISSDHIGHYLRFRRRGVSHPCKNDGSALNRWLNFLRDQGVIPKLVSPPLTPSARVLEHYDDYLKNERLLSWRTRDTYRPLVRHFLESQFGNESVDFARLRPSDIIECVQCNAKRLSSKRAQLMGSALRSCLRFAQYRGDLTLDLAGYVPSVASWLLSTLPKSLPPGQVEKVLSRFPRNSAVGRRDYAILLLLARLGLRACEVVNLTLEDIDWKTGRITIRGKMNRVDQLPLPADAGKAIAQYLKHGRPRPTNTRRLFLLSKAPRTGFKDSSSIAYVVKKALAKAGFSSPLSGTGAHQFRHTLACDMLRRGGSLNEIAEILRHRNPDTTGIYAKVDFLALRPLALPWPGGER